MKSFRSRKMLNGTRSLLHYTFRMMAAAESTNARQMGTVILRSCLRREDVDLPNGRALVHGRRCLTVDRTTSASRTDFRRVDSDSSARANGEAEIKAIIQAQAKTRGERVGHEFH